MPINRHFAPKNKPVNLSNIRPDNLFQHENSYQITNGHNQQRYVHNLESTINNIDFKMKKTNFFAQNKTQQKKLNEVEVQYKNRKGDYTERKTKLQNLRQSIQSLQKIIQKSQQVLNDSTTLNYTCNKFQSSPKHKIKSDSLDIKFSSSTKKMNQRKLKQQKLQNLILNNSINHPINQDQNHNYHEYRENLLNQSIQRKPQNQQNQTKVFNYSIQTPRQNQQLRTQAKYKNPFFQNSTQVKTPTHLNSTLEKLLNQSFQSTQTHLPTLTLNTPSTTFGGQSPKWFQSSQFKILNRLKQKKETKIFKNPLFDDFKSSLQHSPKESLNLNNSTNNRSFKNTQNYRNLDQFPHIYMNQYSHDDGVEQTFNQTKNNILINQSSDICQTYNQNDFIDPEPAHSYSINNLENFTTKNRNSYKEELKLQDSFLKSLQNQKYLNERKNIVNQRKNYFNQKNIQNITFQEKSKQKMVLKTPKVYQNQNQTFSLDIKLVIQNKQIFYIEIFNLSSILLKVNFEFLKIRVSTIFQNILYLLNPLKYVYFQYRMHIYEQDQQMNKAFRFGTQMQESKLKCMSLLKFTAYLSSHGSYSFIHIFYLFENIRSIFYGIHFLCSYIRSILPLSLLFFLRTYSYTQYNYTNHCMFIPNENTRNIQPHSWTQHIHILFFVFSYLARESCIFFRLLSITKFLLSTTEFMLLRAYLDVDLQYRVIYQMGIFLIAFQTVL